MTLRERVAGIVVLSIVAYGCARAAWCEFRDLRGRR